MSRRAAPDSVTRRRRRRRVLIGLGLLTLGLAAGPAAWGPAAAVGVLAAGAGVLLARRVLPRLLPAPPGSARLGRDDRGRVAWLSDAQLGAHVLLVGATGAGKSTTLLTVLGDRIARGHPVVAIDMKGSPAFAEALRREAQAAGRRLRVWTPTGPTHWNPLAHGTPTALKDMLVGSERFSEPHYKRAAERYLQSALQVLEARRPHAAPRLEEVVAAMEPGRLAALAREAPAPLGERVGAYLESLGPDQLSAARGLGTRLALLTESDAGPWLAPAPPDAPELDLGAALGGGDVVLFSINSAVYGALGAQVGALAVQDLTAAAGRRLATGAGTGPAPATVAVDEFSALGSDNLLALLARGREAGVGVLLATQEMSDLERAGRGFRDQVLGITAVTLAHRQEVHESALALSRMAGSREVWREDRVHHPGGRGGAPGRTLTRRSEPVLDPDVIKRLGTGRLVLLTGVPRPMVARVQVRPPRPPRPVRSPSPSRTPGRGGRRRSIRSRDRGGQPPPGVTR